MEEGVRHLAAALDADPRFAQAHNDLGVALRPDDAMLRNNLGLALLELGRTAEAAEQFAKAVRIAPDFAEARENLVRATEGSR